MAPPWRQPGTSEAASCAGGLAERKTTAVDKTRAHFCAHWGRRASVVRANAKIQCIFLCAIQFLGSVLKNLGSVLKILRLTSRLLRIPGRQSRSWDAELSASPFFEVPKQKGRGGLKPDEVVAFLFRILPGVFRILLVVSCKPPALPSKHASHFPPTEQGVQRT